LTFLPPALPRPTGPELQPQCKLIL
jgi:hypothetical protein